jgi:hypothetical protein
VIAETIRAAFTTPWIAAPAIAAFAIAVTFLMTVDWTHQNSHHPET